MSVQKKLDLCHWTGLLCGIGWLGVSFYLDSKRTFNVVDKAKRSHRQGGYRGCVEDVQRMCGGCVEDVRGCGSVERMLAAGHFLGTGAGPRLPRTGAGQ